jgi:archaellum biogenesis ATPase FlaH
MKDIKGEEFIIIDELSILLIYNNENKVAEFVKKTIEYASQHDTKVIAFSPKTKEEELLNKIFNFFDKVEKR